MGLAVTTAGLVIKYLTGNQLVVTAGLSLIVASPITMLAVMATESILKGARKPAILAALTAAIIIASIITSLMRGG